VAGDFDWRNTSNQASTGTGAVVQARAESATGNAGSWSAFGSAANFQFMRVETRSALAVTTEADAGPGSLRQAVADAATLGGPDFILFDPSLAGKTITLTGGEIVLNTDLTIDATALPGGVTLDGNAATRILRVASGVTCTFTALTLANGKAANTGSPLFGNGGGIHNSGTLTVNRCTLTGNATPSFAGGGLSNVNGASLTVNQSTLAGDTAAQGGGIYSDGTLTVNHSTLAGNSAPTRSGGGINIGPSGTLTLTNSIVADNNAQSASSAVFSASPAA
jgi:hypothetical protein